MDVVHKNGYLNFQMRVLQMVKKAQMKLLAEQASIEKSGTNITRLGEEVSVWCLPNLSDILYSENSPKPITSHPAATMPCLGASSHNSLSSPLQWHWVPALLLYSSSLGFLVCLEHSLEHIWCIFSYVTGRNTTGLSSSSFSLLQPSRRARTAPLTD